LDVKRGYLYRKADSLAYIDYIQLRKLHVQRYTENAEMHKTKIVTMKVSRKEAILSIVAN